MSHRTLVAALVSLSVLGLPAAGAHAGECRYLVGPDEPVPFAPNPKTGLIELTVPFTIGDQAVTADIEVAILGFLEVADDGSPRRVLVTHTWTFQENGHRIDWFAEGSGFPTDDPTLIDYTLRLNIAASTGPFHTGSVFVQGVFNLLDATGDAGSWFGKLCS